MLLSEKSFQGQLICFSEIRNLNFKLDFGFYTLDLENFLRAPLLFFFYQNLRSYENAIFTDFRRFWTLKSKQVRF